MAIKDKDQVGTGTRLLQVTSTGAHLAQTPIVLTTGSYTLDGTYSDMFCDCSGGNITLTFPTAVGNLGKMYRAYKTDSTTNTLTMNGTVLGGNLGLSVIVFQSNNTAWKLAHLYDEGTYTATLTGCTTAPTVTVGYVRDGKRVTLRHPLLTAISNTTACTITGMPSHLLPAVATDIPVSNILDNTLDHLGYCTVNINGVLDFSFYTAATTRTSVFTNVGTKGLARSSIFFLQ